MTTSDHHDGPNLANATDEPAPRSNIRLAIGSATVAVFVAAAALVAALVAFDRSNGSPGSDDLPDAQLISYLEAAQSCDAVRDWFVDHQLNELDVQIRQFQADTDAARTVGGDDSAAAREPVAMPSAGAEASSEGAPDTGASGPPTNSYASAPSTTATATDQAQRNAEESAVPAADESGTGTNNQVVGVDEADIVKRRGDLVVSVNNTQLSITRISDGAPVDIGSLVLPAAPYDLLLDDDRAYLLSNSFGDVMPVGGGAADLSIAPSGSRLVEVDISGAPRVVDQIDLDGTVVASRVANGTLRVVTSHTPAIPFGDATTYEATLRQQRDAVESSTIDNWLTPSLQANDCAGVNLPSSYSGTGVITVESIPDGLGSRASVGVVASGENVMATADRLYVATTRWVDPNRATSSDTTMTDIHQFDIGGDAPAAYQASGAIRGSLLNQYSMDEFDGTLRVATTRQVVTAPQTTLACPDNARCARPDIAMMPATESSVSTLRRSGSELVVVGTVDGLAPGETIQSVRFVGTTGYVVTFEQTDPLFAIDLSDPAEPRVLGELKLPGFSSYLHPVQSGFVVGIGYAGDESGLTGAGKVSLFDVRDPRSPKEVASLEVAGEIAAASDPHALAWNADTGLLYLPVREIGPTDEWLDRVMVISVTDAGLTEVAKVGQQPGVGAPAVPDDGAPTSTVPDTTVPDTTVPDTTVPDTTAPDTTVPDTTVPDTTPDTTAPDTTIPDTGAPGTTIADTAARESTSAAGSVSEAIEPDAWATGAAATVTDTVSSTPADDVGTFIPPDVGIGPFAGDTTVRRVVIVGNLLVLVSDELLTVHRADGTQVGYRALR